MGTVRQNGSNLISLKKKPTERRSKKPPRQPAEERAAESELAASREQVRLIVENAREYAIFSMDLDRRITTWNIGAQRLLGFSEEEVLGRSADLIFTQEDCAAGIPEREALTATRDGKAVDERWHVRKDGSRFWASGV